jgi:hypothetical protein
MKNSKPLADNIDTEDCQGVSAEHEEDLSEDLSLK